MTSFYTNLAYQIGLPASLICHVMHAERDLDEMRLWEIAASLRLIVPNGIYVFHTAPMLAFHFSATDVRKLNIWVAHEEVMVKNKCISVLYTRDLFFSMNTSSQRVFPFESIVNDCGEEVLDWLPCAFTKM